MTDRVDPAVRIVRPKSADTISLRELLSGPDKAPVSPDPATTLVSSATPPGAVPEIGGRKDGLDPTRYGDWEKNGRCIDF